MHKYRSTTGAPIRVTTNTGHVAIVESEWRELPAIYHNAAISAGCECDSATIKRNTVAPKASPNAQQDFNEEALIEKALKTMLERSEEGDFKGNGDPNINVVAHLAGFRVTRGQVQPIFERLMDEAEDAEDDADTADTAGDAGDAD